ITTSLPNSPEPSSITRVAALDKGVLKTGEAGLMVMMALMVKKDCTVGIQAGTSGLLFLKALRHAAVRLKRAEETPNETRKGRCRHDGRGRPAWLPSTWAATP